MIVSVVSGGFGYIGSHLLWHLSEQSHKLIVVDDCSNSSPEMLDLPTCQHVELDVRSPDLADVLCEMLEQEKCTSIHFIHLAAESSVPACSNSPTSAYSTNVAGTVNFALAAQRCKASRFIFSSTAAVYSDLNLSSQLESSPALGASVYGRSKVGAESFLRDWSRVTKIPVDVFRFFNVAGASRNHRVGELRECDDHLLPKLFHALENGIEFVVYGNDYDTFDGSCIRDYLHVDDLVFAIGQSLERLKCSQPSYSVFNLGSETGFSVFQMLESVENVLGVRIPAKVSGGRDGDPARLVASIQKAKRELQWSPRCSLIDIIESGWAWRKFLNG